MIKLSPPCSVCRNLLAMLVVIVPLHACDHSTTPGSDGTDTYKTVEWIDLMPANDLDALLNPPDYVMQVEEGSMDDEISDKLKSSQPKPVDDPYQQALVSTRVRSEMDGTNIRIPGYIVPLEFDENQSVREFFLVPYFGACIHVPPPPPNQIILMQSEKGLEFDDLYNAYWLSGELRTSLQENELASSAYSMKVKQFELYTGP